MFLKRWSSLLHILISFEWKRMKYFKMDFVINFLGKVMFLLTNLLFWYSLSSAGYELPGWTYQNVIIFIAFSELFYGLDGAVFSMASRFWRYIYSGNLDCGLVRPIDPRVRFLLLNIDYVGLVCTFIEFMTILLFAHADLSFFAVVLGVIFVLWANVILSIIRSCMSYLAFWHGKMEAISEVSDAMSTFNKYPLVIMPKPVIELFKILLPFYFFSTMEAELVNQMIGVKEGIFSVVAFLVCTMLWVVLNNIVWKKGLIRYEGLNG